MSVHSALAVSLGAAAGWRLGEPSGSFVDFIGGWNGTAVGSITARNVASLLDDGDTDGAVNFGGAGGIDVASFTLTASDTFTIEAYIKWVSGSFTILDRGTNMYHFHTNSSGNIVLDKSQISQIVASTSTLSSGVKAHAVAVKNAGVATKLYINGVDVTGSVSNATMAANWNQLGIGVDRGGTAYANGVLDEVYVYPTALTDQNVADLFAATQAGTGLGASTGMLGIIAADGYRSAHRPPWMLPMMRFGRKSNVILGQPGIVPDVGPVVATPGTATLNLTTFAPSVLTPVLVTPPVASLTLTTFAPTVQTPVLVTPPVKALTLTTFAPSVLVPVLVTPSVAVLTLTTFAPTASATNALVVVPGVALLVLTTFRPSVSTSTNFETPEDLARDRWRLMPYYFPRVGRRPW